MENLRVDVIYYTVQSDFEMEFNLGGCCRMRLLTACTEDRKAHLKALSYAVSRSKIILTCGPLFGQSGLIYITAKAIGKDLIKINNKDYGIADEGEIEIINGSLPLVTSNGIFGGCIIESGPQTLIMLSENRAIRKDIMQNLIHPYIEEISYLDVSKGLHKEQAEETSFPETEGVPAPVAEEVPSEEIIPDEATENEVNEESENTQETTGTEAETNDSVPLVSFESGEPENQEQTQETDEEKQEEKPETPVKEETQKPTPQKEEKSAYTPFVFEEENEGNPEDGYYDEDYYLDENANSSNKIAVFIIVAMILIIAVTLGYIFLYLPYKEGVSISDFARKLFSSFGL